VPDAGRQVRLRRGILLVGGGNHVPIGYYVAVRTINESGAFDVISQTVIERIPAYSEPDSNLEVDS
jgi:hypothetical protein